MKVSAKLRKHLVDKIEEYKITARKFPTGSQELSNIESIVTGFKYTISLIDVLSIEENERK